MGKCQVYPDVNLNLIMVHGVYSNGAAFEALGKQFKADSRLHDLNVWVSLIKYGVTTISGGYLPFRRNLIAKYVASRIATCNYKYPNAKTVVLCHSFGTYSTARAVFELFDEFKVDMIILVGSVVKRKYNWDRYGIEVHNFIGRKDWVVFMSKIWLTGWSGCYGFDHIKNRNKSVTEHNKPSWRHLSYPKGFDEYVDLIREYIKRNPSVRKLALTSTIDDTISKKKIESQTAALVRRLLKRSKSEKKE